MDNGFGAPRSAWQLLLATAGLYRRYPWLFLVLAAGVIVPYRLVLLAVSGSGSGEGSGWLELVTTIADWALITPLVSALHVHAVDEARQGGDPRLGHTARMGLRALPLVALVCVVSGVVSTLGFFLFLIPGLILTLRWYVVAQAAAIEREPGLKALGRSADLVRDHYGHVIGLAIAVAIIGFGPLLAFSLLYGDAATTPASFLAETTLDVISVSVAALTSALLYFDLRVRAELVESVRGSDVPQPAGESPSPTAIPTGEHGWDPGEYSDQDRPRGWYIDPGSPKHMRYWGAGEQRRWTGRRRTPFKLRRASNKQAAGEG